MSKKIVTATLSLALGLLPASGILAADGAAAPAGNNKPGTEVHADAKPADAKKVHKDRHETKGDAKEVHKDAKAVQKKKLRWTNRRHLKHDMTEPSQGATESGEAKEGGEPAAGDEQNSSH